MRVKNPLILHPKSNERKKQVLYDTDSKRQHDEV